MRRATELSVGEPCAGDGGVRACESACGPGLQACSGGFLGPCVPAVTERPCTKGRRSPGPSAGRHSAAAASGTSSSELSSSEPSGSARSPPLSLVTMASAMEVMPASVAPSAASTKPPMPVASA